MSLVIINHEFRIHDNTALHHAIRSGNPVFIVYVYDLSNADRDYSNKTCIEFLLCAITTLYKQLDGRLTVLTNMAALEKFCLSNKISDLYSTIDYSPVARERTLTYENMCKKIGITLHTYHDYVLRPQWFEDEKNGGYKKFTPYFNYMQQFPVALPYGTEKLIVQNSTHFNEKLLRERDLHAEAIKLLNQSLDLIDEDRDFPAKASASGLSRYLRYGILSIRQVYWAWKKHKPAKETLIRQIYWREFYYQFAWYFPKLMEPTRIPWNTDEAIFNAWREGRTGYPLVDAGMRQLLTTNHMHNRLRMVVASFLCKVLGINWTWGEKHFEIYLLDHDKCQNNGGWQWCAGTGTDNQPYFRTFNPTLQIKKHDPDCTYIKTYVAELADVDPSVINAGVPVPGYIKPIVNYEEAKKYMFELRKKLKQQ